MRMICLEPAHVSGPNQADSLCRVAKQRNWLLRNSTRTFPPVSIILSDVRDHNPLLGYRRLRRLLEIAPVFKSLDEGRGLRTKPAHLEILPNPPVPMNPEISGSLPNRCPKGPACHSHTPWGRCFWVYADIPVVYGISSTLPSPPPCAPFATIGIYL